MKKKIYLSVVRREEKANEIGSVCLCNVNGENENNYSREEEKESE